MVDAVDLAASAKANMTFEIDVPGNEELPAAVHCRSSSSHAVSLEWIERHLDRLAQLLTDHGAILFRGWPITVPQDFDEFVGRFPWDNFPYEKSLSNAVRVNKTDRVFTANEAPAEIEIFLHHEMAQTPIFPTRIFFCCLEAADKGGQTPICRSDLLFDRLHESYPTFVRDCEERGLKYSNVMPAENDFASGMGRSWQSTLSVDSKEAAANRLNELGYTAEWLENGCLRATTPTLPAVYEFPDGRKAFFNQLIAAFKGWKDSRNDPSSAIRHGDNEPLDTQAVQGAIDIAYEITHDLQWQAGDIALVDNLKVMHGRRPFQGSRTVLASLAAVATHGV